MMHHNILSTLSTALLFAAIPLAAGQNTLNITSPVKGDVLNVGFPWQITWETNIGGQVLVYLKSRSTGNGTTMLDCGLMEVPINNIGHMRWDVAKTSTFDGGQWLCENWNNSPYNTDFYINIVSIDDRQQHYSFPFKIQHQAA